MEIQDIYLGRQPIIDRNQRLVAFELLFRDGHNGGAKISDDLIATANVIVNAFGALGLRSVLGPQRGFVNVSADLLLSDLVSLLPKDQIVLEVLETVDVTEGIVRRCAELKQDGYQLALDDIEAIDERVRPLLPLADVIKVDLIQVAEDALPGLAAELRQWPGLKLAEKVGSREQAERCHALGFDLFQGYYFARPQVLSGKRADPSRAGLLRLLSLVMGDAEVETLEEEFKRQPHLSFQLLRMVNSVASGLSTKIGSLRHGIFVLGRTAIRRWVQLLLYTTGKNGRYDTSPLMQLAATRGKTMEILAVKRDRKSADQRSWRGFFRCSTRCFQCRCTRLSIRSTWRTASSKRC